MKLKGVPLLCSVLLLAGCQSPRATPGNPPAAFKLDRKKSVEITSGDDEFTRRRATAGARAQKDPGSREPVELTEGELVELPKMTVSRKGLLNLGLSVVTNLEVMADEKIEWMRVGVVLPGSPAARAGLVTGVEILAIDGIPLAELRRERMLHALFEREPGERVRLLVYSQQLGPLPRFVTLAGPTRPAK